MWRRVSSPAVASFSGEIYSRVNGISGRQVNGISDQLDMNTAFMLTSKSKQKEAR